MKVINKEIVNKFGKHYLLGLDQDGKKVYLQAPSWDCNWYWGFGYVHQYTAQNVNMARDISYHVHWDSSMVGKIEGAKDYTYHINSSPNFTATVLTDKEAWDLSDLMQSFYTLSKTAELYHRGNSNYTTGNGLEDKLKSQEQYDNINKVLLPAIFQRIDELLSPGIVLEAK